MTCKCAPALLQLRSQVDALYPKRDKSSDGCCGDAAHAARKSDHNPVDGYAHAMDIDEDIAPNRGDRPLMPWIRPLLADPRARYVIYEKRIYFAQCRDHVFPCQGHDYHGINAHQHHLHLSIKATATFDVRLWKLGPVESKEDDDVWTKEQQAEIDAIRAHAEAADNRASNLERWVPRIAAKLGIPFDELDKH